MDEAIPTQGKFFLPLLFFSFGRKTIKIKLSETDRNDTFSSGGARGPRMGPVRLGWDADGIGWDGMYALYGWYVGENTWRTKTQPTNKSVRPNRFIDDSVSAMFRMKCQDAHSLHNVAMGEFFLVLTSRTTN